jgi:hypothetical protein
LRSRAFQRSPSWRSFFDPLNSVHWVKQFVLEIAEISIKIMTKQPGSDTIAGARGISQKSTIHRASSL